MTNSEQHDELQFTATDFRRASAILTHAVCGDAAGMSAVWFEAAAADAVPDVAAALVVLFVELSPELRTPDGMAALRELTRSWAAAEVASCE